MKGKWLIPGGTLVGGLLLGAMLARGQPPETAEYVGHEQCKMCHSDLYQSWSRTRHAKAFDLLVNAGKENDPACLKCHTTGYGNEGYGKSDKSEELKGVTCEACHGPGGNHNGDKTRIIGQPLARTCTDPCHKELNIH
jgi:hypothetical protein